MRAYALGDEMIRPPRPGAGRLAWSGTYQLGAPPLSAVSGRVCPVLSPAILEHVSLSRPSVTPLAIQSIGRFSGDRRPRRTVTQKAEECHSRVSAAWVLVVAPPPVRCDHRQYEPAALADQILVGVPVAVAHCFWHPGEVVLDWPVGAVLEVCEQRPVLRAEHIPRVGLAVQ